MVAGAEHEAALDRLEADGLIERGEGGARTTRKWQGAMARAALSLYERGDQGKDLRVPIAFALLEQYGKSMADDVVARLVEAMLPIEANALGLGRIGESQ